MSSKPAAAKVVRLPTRREDDVAQQLALLPLQVDAEFHAQFKSADLKTVVRCLDGHFYALKSKRDHPLLPASEFLCYRLASACHVAVPFSAILASSDGANSFGSRFESATTEFTAAGPKMALEMFRQCKAQISATLAFDLFVGNEDRHRNNFLFRKNHQDQWAPLAIDYSRAFLVRGFPNDNFPMAETSHTRSTIAQLKASDLWDGPHAVLSIGTVQQVSADHVEHWCKEMPADWLPKALRDGLLTWWSSPARIARLNSLYDLL